MPSEHRGDRPVDPAQVTGIGQDPSTMERLSPASTMIASPAGAAPACVGRELALARFSCARFRFRLEVESPLRLNAFAGSTLRGGFGHVFKRAVCTWPPGDCPRCLLRSTCAYPYIFETAPPPVGHRTTFEVTSPWSFTAPTRLCAVIGRPGSA